MSATPTPDHPPAAPALDFDALYRDARDDVYAYVVTLLRDRAAAEDVTAHGVRARLPQAALATTPARGSARAWLFGIARNAALDELRRRKRTATLVAEPGDAAAARPRTPPSARSPRRRAQRARRPARRATAR